MERVKPAPGWTSLAAAVERQTGRDGLFPTAIEGLQLVRASQPSALIPTVYEPCLCLIVQGSKHIIVGGEVYRYDPARYLLVAVDLPVAGQVVEASPQTPYLGLRLGIDLKQASSLIAEIGDPTAAASEAVGGLSSRRGLFVACVDDALRDAVGRLLRLLETPQHIAVLVPLIQREILYLLLMGEQGAALRRISRAGGEMESIRPALHRLKQNFAEPLRIETLAREVHMSQSRFHLHFKAVTAMTPLQYQKRLRLQEARRLMLGEALDASTACYQVGYESPSQFSREYRRLFGNSPRRDTARLRDAP